MAGPAECPDMHTQLSLMRMHTFSSVGLADNCQVRDGSVFRNILGADHAVLLIHHSGDNQVTAQADVMILQDAGHFDIGASAAFMSHEPRRITDRPGLPDPNGAG